MVEIELRIADGGFRIVDGGLGGPLFSGALVCDFDAAVARLFERVGAEEFLFGEIEPGMRRLELRSRFAELDLIRSRIDLEEKIALLDNVPIFEADLRQGAADLRAQLNILHGRKLTKELNSRGKTTQHWDGHRDGRWRGCHNLSGGRGKETGTLDDTSGDQTEHGHGSRPSRHNRLHGGPREE